MAKAASNADIALEGMFQDSDVMNGGWIRVGVVARRLNQRSATIYAWHNDGIGVGRGKERREFFLKLTYFGRDARTKLAWLEKFFREAEAYRQKLRAARR